MDNDRILELTSQIEETLGKDNFATISDTIGELLTGNDQNLKALAEREEEITKLKNKNEKLVAANGALLQKIPVGFESAEKEKKEAPQPKLSMKDAFDKNGNFIH